MKLFRIRFIVLGLLLCVVHVWCRTCGTEFTDPGSSSYLAEVVVEGRVSAIKQTNIQGRFNITISIRKVRKGTDRLLRGRKTKRLTIGEFGSENLDECVTNIKRTKNKYFFFLKSTDSKEFFKISSFPVISTKQSGRLVRKGACKTCGKEPVLRKIKVKKFKVGKRLQLRCRLRSGKPDPKFHWTKDGVLLPEKRKGLQIKSKRRWSQIKIKKATKEDEGVYKCFATNVVGSTYQVARVKVLPIPPPRRPTVKTTTASQDRYLPCKKEDQGYCLNGGTCRIIKDLDFKSCACSASYEGVRCQFRAIPRRNLETDSRENSGQNQQRDRTLTIIGIVIGILIFVCFCIASYFIAKKRRTAYLKKKALQRKHANGQLYSSPNHSPYHAMNPVTDPIPEKAKLFLRQDTINMETQTEDFLNLLPPYPNTNHNRPTIHLNPLDNIVLRNPPPKRNSRSRLSGVSTTNDRPTSQPEVESPKADLVLKSSSDHERPSGILGDQGIPRLRVSSESVSDSENRDEDMASLHISEDDHDTSSRNPYIYPNETNKLLSKNSSFDTNLSQNSSHIDFSDTDEEVQKLQTGSFGEKIIRKCSDTLSWNERGSPEQLGKGLCFDIEDPRYIKSKPYDDGKNVLDICNYNSPYNGSDIRENEPSIPV